MTLLLNLVGPSGIHQSSDYRLTDIVTRHPIEDSFGSKQLHFDFSSWSAQISFTGIAEFGGRKTRDWISQTVGSMPRSAEVLTVMGSLAERATNELRAVPSHFRQLTIVVTVSERARPDRLFVLSCIDRPTGPPLAQALDQFSVYEFSSNRQEVLIFGVASAVGLADRKLLKDLNHGGRDPSKIRAVLAQINSRAAKRSNGFISEGCLVSSLLPDGTSASENFGLTPGVPADMVGSKDVAELIAKSLPGKRPTFVQSRGVRAEGKKEVTTPPMNVPEGDTLIVRTRGNPLFVTDAAGNTFTSMPGAPTPDEEDEEIGTGTEEARVLAELAVMVIVDL
jgi:hypothetical protein